MNTVSITIWAHSFCRSTLATYLAVADFFPGVVEIIVCGPPDPELRKNAGFSSHEFDSCRFLSVNPDLSEALKLLSRNKSSIHMFCSYQNDSFFKALLSSCVKNNIQYFIASESPINMESGLFRRLLKWVYIKYILRVILYRYIKNSMCFVNYSGSGDSILQDIGWDSAKIIKFGYYPPPIAIENCDVEFQSSESSPNSNVVTFLVTGTHCNHKSPISAIYACRLLVERGYSTKFRILLTGNGCQSEAIRDVVSRFNLPVTILGFVSLAELVALYNSADVFIATGLYEPWGIRVNDALNFACPCIVSDGMGVVDLVESNQAGWRFAKGNFVELANVMASRIDRGDYREVHEHLIKNREFLSPEFNARRLVASLLKKIESRNLPVSSVSVNQFSA